MAEDSYLAQRELGLRPGLGQQDTLVWRRAASLSAIILAGSILVSCSDTRHENEAKARVLKQMFDPTAATFKNVHTYKKNDGGWTVCGDVNGKNRFGGYVGYERFVVVDSNPEVFLEHGKGDSDLSEKYGDEAVSAVVNALFDKLCADGVDEPAKDAENT